MHKKNIFFIEVKLKLLGLKIDLIMLLPNKIDACSNTFIPLSIKQLMENTMK
jgi:hypothetical protein